MKRTFLFLIILSCGLLINSPVWAITVLTSIKPVAGITLAVMDGVGKPEVLLHDQASEHEYHLKPSDRQKIADADLVIWVSPELESFLITPLQQLKPSQKCLTLLPFSTTLLPLVGDPTSSDPHAWLLPSNAAAWAVAIANALSEKDPANRARYQKNARVFATKAQQLELEKSLTTRYIAYHDGLQYFDWFAGSKTIASLHVHDHEGGAEAHHLAEIHELLAKKQSICIGTEPYIDDPLVHTLARKYGAHPVLLDPLGVQIRLDKHYYQHLIEYHRNILKGC